MAMKPGSFFRGVGALTAGLLLCLSLAGCLEMDATLTVAQDSKLRLSASYSVSTLVYPLVAGGERAFAVRPPMTRQELEAVVAGLPGARLLSFTETASSAKRGVSAQLEFPNPDSFCSFLTTVAGGASFQSSNGRRELAVTLPCPAPRADKELLSSLEVLFGDYDLALKVNLPSAALSAPAGKTEGKSASFGMKLVDLVKSGKNAVWAVSW